MSVAEPSPKSYPQEQTRVLFRLLEACPARFEIFLQWRVRQAVGEDDATVFSSLSAVLAVGGALGGAHHALMVRAEALGSVL